jgi:hypothetical protein
MRWETDIDPMLLKNLKFKFRMANKKSLEVQRDKLSTLNDVMDLAVEVFLTAQESKKTDDGDSDIVREYKKQLIGEYLPELDIERLEELANVARDKANGYELSKTDSSENLVDDATEES